MGKWSSAEREEFAAAPVPDSRRDILVSVVDGAVSLRFKSKASAIVKIKLVRRLVCLVD
jgi:hypothetical protein